MTTVILLSTSLALASPQYNYAQPSGVTGLGHSNIGSIGHAGGVAQGISGSSLNHGIGGGVSHTGIGHAGHGYAAAGGQTHETIVTKQFLIHSAPHEQDEVGGDKVINLGPARKNYRVVFIKAPHQGAQAGKVRFIAPANEEKTVIYVLSKKTDLADIQADVQQAHSEPTKPEVHFIKYKTAEEAVHAQRTIQAQFDAIEGKSQISDEGVAPLTSVIGALGDASSHDVGVQGSAGSFSGAAGGSVSNSYLPPSY
ncbi:uncharacterized protein LOC129613865 [Condylostylus longicornis]|uniref:uncharacterized protein LOC129613865 n=1 Tax=Condylostylus longicornis TaxID=2530218 RepID=UPI00244DD842|nr:uncharacterized protein LOC129613865 [Condylostylus longicornis]